MERMRPDTPKHIADRDGGVLLKMAGCSAMNPGAEHPPNIGNKGCSPWNFAILVGTANQ